MASSFKRNILKIKIPFLIFGIRTRHSHCYLLILLVCTAPAIQMPKRPVYNHFTESGFNVSCNYYDKTYKKKTTTSARHPRICYGITERQNIVLYRQKIALLQQRNPRCSKDLSLFCREEESARDVRPASRSRWPITQSHSTKSVY